MPGRKSVDPSVVQRPDLLSELLLLLVRHAPRVSRRGRAGTGAERDGVPVHRQLIDADQTIVALIGISVDETYAAVSRGARAGCASLRFGSNQTRKFFRGRDGRFVFGRAAIGSTRPVHARELRLAFPAELAVELVFQQSKSGRFFQVGLCLRAFRLLWGRSGSFL